MQRIIYTKNDNFLGLPLKGRMGTIHSTTVDKKNKKTYHNVRFEGIDGHTLQLSVKALNSKTMPVLN